MVFQQKWLASVAFLASALCLQAQEARGTLLGRVTDTSDALFLGAKVDALNVDTGVRFSSVTNKYRRLYVSAAGPGHLYHHGRASRI